MPMWGSPVDCGYTLEIVIPETAEAFETSETTKASTSEKLSLHSIIRSRFARLEVVNVEFVEFFLEIIHLCHLRL